MPQTLYSKMNNKILNFCIVLQWLSFGNYWRAAAKIRAGNIPLITMVQSTEEAVRAAAEGADLVVAQVRQLKCIQPFEI